MSKSLFAGGSEPCCEICTHGRKANDSTKILCCKKGVVDALYKCSKFKYDPLKRVPHHMPPLKHHDIEEFKL